MSRFLPIFSFISISAAAAVFGPEVPLSPPTVMSAPYGQHLAGVASNGRDFLAIWLDQRSSVPTVPNAPSALYVSRLDRSGRPQNSFGSKLSDAVYSAALVWTPAGYLVLWSDKAEVNSMLLNDDGVPVSAPKRLSGGYVSAAASNGKTLFVIHGPLSQSQAASVFALDGTLMSETTFDSQNRIAQTLVMPNSDYGVITQQWTCPGSIPCTVTATLTTISDSGVVTSKALEQLSQWSQARAVIGNGRLLLAWMDDYNGSGSVRGSRILWFRVFDLTGIALTREKTLAATGDIQSISGTYGSSVGWDGQQFLVAWQWPASDGKSGEIRAVRVTTDGIAIDATPTILSQTLGGLPWFATSGTSQLVAWDTFQYRNSHLDIHGAPSFDLLNAATTYVMPQSAALQTEVQLATLGSKTLAAWREGETNPTIMAALIGGAPILISRGGTLDQHVPAIGTSRDQYVVVWREESQQSFSILARRVAADGTVLDRDPIVVAADAPFNGSFLPAANNLAVASDGKDFFVAWPGVYDRLLAARLSAAGVVLDATPIELSQPPNGTAGSPRVIWNGSQYLVFWTADPSCKLCLSPPGPPVSQIFVGRVGPDGKLIDSQKVWSGGYGSRVAVARSPKGFMLAWPISGGSGAVCIYSMPIGDDGAPNGPQQTLMCTQGPTWPPQFPDFDLAWDGAMYVAAWTEVMSTSAAAKAIRFSPTGAPADAEPFELAPASFQPALAPASSGVTIAYSRIAQEEQYGGVARVFARLLQSFNAPPRRRVAR